VLSGCGVLTKQNLKPQAPTLTHGRFVYLADRICRRDIRRSRALSRKPKNPTQFERELQAVLKSYERALFDLRALAPPTADAESFRHLLAAFNLQDLLGNNWLQASEQGEVRRFESIAGKLDRNDKTLKSRARALGLRACAKE
jgi:hypothetical protein